MLYTTRRLILKNGFSPGGIVMLTAGVRDLHRYFPSQFLTGVRTTGPEVCEKNPYVIPLFNDDSGVEVLDCLTPKRMALTD